MAVITISRQFGAGGLQLGNKLCEKFGYLRVDGTLINEMARKDKVSTDWLDAVEKHASSEILDFFSSVVSKGSFYPIPNVAGEEFERKKYVDFLKQIMTAMAEKGGYVIVGRGSQFILKGYPKVIHVLLVGEFRDRVRFIEAHYDLSPSQAEALVSEKEKERALLASNIFKAEIDDPSLYDIVLNTSRVNMDWAVELISKLVDFHIQGERDEDA